MTHAASPTRATDAASTPAPEVSNTASADPADRCQQALPELVALAAAGRLSVPIWRTYPLAEAARAHEDLEAGRNHGKIVLLPDRV